MTIYKESITSRELEILEIYLQEILQVLVELMKISSRENY